jgi:succinate dehydrogenase/fumarate reductase flavoprotein subunit
MKNYPKRITANECLPGRLDMARRLFVFLVIALVMFAGCEAEIKYRDKIVEVDSSDWLGSPPGITESMLTASPKTADVVVVGAGISGLSAARAAAEAGADVIVIEKRNDIFIRGLCFGALNSSYQKSIGYELTDPQLMEAALELHKLSGNRANLALWVKWAFESGAAFDWFAGAFTEQGSGYTPVTDFPLLGAQKGATAADGTGAFSGAGTNDRGYYLQYYPLVGTNITGVSTEMRGWPHYATSHNFQTATGMDGNWPLALRAQKNAAEKNGAQFVFDSEAKELILDGAGNVVGVYVEGPDGYFKVTANKGVILATGDYSGDKKMVTYLCPEYKAMTGSEFYANYDGSPAGGTGDGHKMAIWAGGMMEPSPHAPMAHSMNFFSQIGVASALQLNANGERFMNEDVSGQLITNGTSRQPNRLGYQIYDSDVATYLPKVMNDSHGALDFSNNADVASIQAAITALDPAGQAMTLEALVEQMFPGNADAQANALAAITRYNQLAAAGFDADFGVEADKMWPLLQPPYFFGGNFVAGAVITSGVMVNSDLRVLKAADYKPIPGLWAVGNTAGGRYAGDYPVHGAAATSHGTAVTFGKSAGIDAANYTRP